MKVHLMSRFEGLDEQKRSLLNVVSDFSARNIAIYRGHLV